MRNHSTPIVVYPHSPSSEIKDAHAALTAELNAQSYRVLPEDEFDPIRHVSRSELAVLLLDATYRETARRLVEHLTKMQKPFVVWPSPSLQTTTDLTQQGFLKELTELEYPPKNLLSPFVTPEKLKEDVLAIARPQAKIPPFPKPLIYLIFDPAQRSEAANAGQIILNYHQEFHFESNRDPRRHTAYLTQSDGVLLVWGDAAEDWCASEFDQMVRLSNRPKSRGLCFFNPKKSKSALAEQIRTQHSDVCVAEQFGSFDRMRLEPFFKPIRSSRGANA